MACDGINEIELKKMREEYIKTNKFCFSPFCPPEKKEQPKHKKCQRKPPKDLAKQREMVQKWQEKNKDRLKELRKKYSEEHREELNARAREKRRREKENGLSREQK